MLVVVYRACVRARSTLLCGHHHRFSLQYIPVIIVLSSATCLPGKNIINKYIYTPPGGIYDDIRAYRVYIH